MSKVIYTPMIQQYLKIKEDYADAVVFFRLGDFYEMFFDDAILASKILEIQLTSREAGTTIPMCGIPYHASKTYIQKLIDKGLKIAIAEQVSLPGKGLVERKVIRTITPGTIYEEDILDANKHNYIASIHLNEIGYQLTYVDISTGDAYIKEALNIYKVIQNLKDLSIKEVVLIQKFDTTLIAKLEENNILISYVDLTEIEHNAIKKLNKSQKDGAYILFSYLSVTQASSLDFIEQFELLVEKDLLFVDSRVKKHLEIFESLNQNHDKTLLALLDKTKTAAGSRLLKHYLNNPTTSINTLTERHNYIESLLSKISNLTLLENALENTFDVSRIVGRVIFQSASPRDLYNLKRSLDQLPNLKNILYSYNDKLLTKLADDINLHEDLQMLLEKSIVNNPPLSLKEGNVIKEKYNEELDYLRTLDSAGEKWLEDFETSEKERTGIKNLKVGFSKNYGYYIEISKAQSLLVTEEFGYERKQTLVNNERFISPILKEKENDLLHAAEKIVEFEYELFADVREQVLTYQTSLNHLSHLLAFIDVFVNLARVAVKNSYVKPVLSTTNRKVEIINGRHPVVENYTTFIKNNVEMNEGEVFIITGPNMSGKSTYMRMYALIVYMAQIGSYVPADSAKLPIYDSLFTRIGSSDDLASGKSTFMVEMVESNDALTNATKNSLIVFDEIGRGTATFDGMALASSMIEYIVIHIGAHTLFSTHYHEITDLANKYSKIKNMHVSAKLEKGNITFLHQIKEGSTDRSYGIHVAKLANLPSEVIAQSQKILNKLEKNKKDVVDIFNYENNFSAEEITTNNIVNKEIFEQIKNVDLNLMTPIDALNFLSVLKKELEDKEG